LDSDLGCAIGAGDELSLPKVAMSRWTAIVGVLPPTPRMIEFRSMVIRQSVACTRRAWGPTGSGSTSRAFWSFTAGADINEADRAMQEGEVARTVLTFDELPLGAEV
jgi:hypothetical protein